MNLRTALAAFVAVSSIFILSCSTGGDSPTDGDGAEKTLTVRLINLPAEADGKYAEIYVLERTGTSVWIGNGMIADTVALTGGTWSATVKTLALGASVPGDSAATYETGAELSYEVYIDMDGNGEFSETGDVCDGIAYEGIPNTGAIDIDYGMLNVL